MIMLEQVCKSYDGGVRYTVRDVSFRVPPGNLMVLLGGSGCGKTTTLKMINRLIEPTGGRVEVSGRDVRKLDTSSCAEASVTCFRASACFPT